MIPYTPVHIYNLVNPTERTDLLLQIIGRLDARVEEALHDLEPYTERECVERLLEVRARKN